MAKKIEKVVVSQAYFNLLVDKANMLTDLFEDDKGEVGAVTIAASDFKDYGKVKKAFEKIDTTVEPYEG